MSLAFSAKTALSLSNINFPSSVPTTELSPAETAFITINNRKTINKILSSLNFIVFLKRESNQHINYSNNINSIYLKLIKPSNLIKSTIIVQERQVITD